MTITFGSARVGLAMLLAFSCLALAATGQAQAQSGRCTATPAEIFKAVSPAVVFIGTRRINPYAVQGRVERALGSGFIFDARGLILTNSHVVFGAQSISVTLDNGAVRPAKLIAADPIFDIAVIQIFPPKGTTVPTIPPADSAAVAIGDDVIAIGNPLGLEQTLTTGVVSGINRILPETPLSLTRALIQTDAAINPGNSGGPLLDRCGRVVGINTAIIAGAQNIGFAIPIDLVKSTLPSLLKNGRVLRPWVGFHGKLIDEDIREILNVSVVPGLLVEVVEPGSPAAKNKIQGGVFDVSLAGNELLLGGDIITKINGIAMSSPESLQRTMGALAVGQRLSLEAWRDGKMRSIQYKLPERPLLPRDIPD